MRRRELITLLGGAAAAWPLAARAQQPAIPVVGFLNGASPEAFPEALAGFRKGLTETGHFEGRNVTIEYSWAEDYDRLPVLAADLVRRPVALIAASGNASSRAAKAATTTIPIVFVVGVDPVAFGLVSSLNRPGGNLTGVTDLNTELTQKRLELLRELVPKTTVVALLVNPASGSAETQSKGAQAAARALGLQLHVLQAGTERDLDAVFVAVVRLRAAALLVGADVFLHSRRDQLVALAARQAVPTMYESSDFVAAGGLMSYGIDFADAYRLGGIYVGRILKGEKPADLPVQQATKIDLVINLKTAKALGITVPPLLLARADEVIE